MSKIIYFLLGAIFIAGGQYVRENYGDTGTIILRTDGKTRIKIDKEGFWADGVKVEDKEIYIQFKKWLQEASQRQGGEML